MGLPVYRYRLGWRSLQHVCPNLTDAKAKSLAVDLAAAMRKYGITTPTRAAAFIAQIAHESDRFATATEYASGAEYEGLRTLGNTHPGDGVRFKGRGYLQITGRTNYAAVSHAFGVDFLASPSKLAAPKYAALASAWWWKTHGCNELADRDFVELTERINGGTNGLADRKALYARAREVSAHLVPKRRKP